MMFRLRRAARALLLGSVLSFGAAFALPVAVHADGDAATDRAQSFEAVSGAVKEDVPGGPLLVAAYALIWLAVLGYVFRLVRLQKGADENLARLQQDLQRAAQRSAPK